MKIYNSKWFGSQRSHLQEIKEAIRRNRGIFFKKKRKVALG